MTRSLRGRWATGLGPRLLLLLGEYLLPLSEPDAGVCFLWIFTHLPVIMDKGGARPSVNVTFAEGEGEFVLWPTADLEKILITCACCGFKSPEMLKSQPFTSVASPTF